MIHLSQITRQFAVRSLASTVCPACGKTKKTRQTLCAAHYFKLPKQLRDATYAPLGRGYQEAVVEALNFLEVEKPIDPDQANLFKSGGAA